MQKQFTYRKVRRQMSVFMFALMFCISGVSAATVKTLIDYFQPTPIFDKLSTTAWGAAQVGPRDIHNGLEDSTIKQWCYWDGKIIKGPDGKYHMFASRWDQANGHSGWGGSKAVHAVADKPTGPYVDKGLCWPDNSNGKGHNVTALALLDGTYAVLVSDTRPGDFFTSKSLDGPWAYQGSVKIDANGFSVPAAKNLSFLERPDGSFLMVSKHGMIMISTSGLTGPYKVQGNSVFPQAYDGANEDPVIWFSGGLYHIVANWYSARKSLHLTSVDGITNWKNMGLACDPTSDFVRYTDGTVNHWYNMERPGVLIENGHVTAFTFAVVDVPKSQELGNDQNGSKVIVVPFDGASFDGVTSNIEKGPGAAATRGISLSVKVRGLSAQGTVFIPAEAVSGTARLSVALYDLKGRLVSHENTRLAIDKSQAINLDLDGSRMGPGIYCITVRCNNRNFYGHLNVQ
jgi:hypothetical protein